MPRKDPISGCTVAHPLEVISEGTMIEVWNELDADSRRIEKEYRDTALQTLQRFQQELKEDNPDLEIHYPIQIHEFIDCSHSQGLMNSGGGFLVKAMCSDGKKRFFAYSEWFEANTRIDPGDCGEDVMVYNLPDTLEDNEVLALFAMGKYGINWKSFEVKFGYEVYKSLHDKGLATIYPGEKYRRTELGTYVLTCQDTVKL